MTDQSNAAGRVYRDRLGRAITDAAGVEARRVQQQLRRLTALGVKAEAQARAAYAAGWRAGAEKMREACAAACNMRAADASLHPGRTHSDMTEAARCAAAICWAPLPKVEYPEEPRDVG